MTIARKSYVYAGVRTNRIHTHMDKRNFGTGYDVQYEKQPVGRVMRIIGTKKWICVPLIGDGSPDKDPFPRKRPTDLGRKFDTRAEAIEGLVKYQIQVGFVSS